MINNTIQKIRNTLRYLDIKTCIDALKTSLNFIFTKKKRIFNDYLSIAAVIKDEAPYLEEWIEYHKLVGVTRFYLCDAATDDTKKILQPYINSGLVVYSVDRRKHIQVSYYNKILRYARNVSQWVAYIDADEFIAPVGGYETVVQLLKEFESYPALGINWITYDSNGHNKRPDGLVLKNYTRVYQDDDEPQNRHIKSIIQPNHTLCNMNGPHWFVCSPFSRHRWAVSENYEIIKGAFSKQVSVNKIRLCHYYTKSLEEYTNKCEKGCIDNKYTKRPFLIERCNIPNSKQDNTMLKYVERLENILQKGH